MTTKVRMGFDAADRVVPVENAVKIVDTEFDEETGDIISQSEYYAEPKPAAVTAKSYQLRIK